MAAEIHQLRDRAGETEKITINGLRRSPPLFFGSVVWRKLRDRLPTRGRWRLHRTLRTMVISGAQWPRGQQTLL